MRSPEDELTGGPGAVEDRSLLAGGDATAVFETAVTVFGILTFFAGSTAGANGFFSPLRPAMTPDRQPMSDPSPTLAATTITARNAVIRSTPRWERFGSTSLR